MIYVRKKQILFFFCFLSILCLGNVSHAGSNPGKVARQWVDHHVRNLSEKLARQTILRSLNELNLQAFNTLDRNYKRSMELYPDIEKHWFLLRSLDLKSVDLQTVHASTRRVLWAARKTEAIVSELSLMAAEVSRTEAEQKRLHSGEHTEEFFSDPYLFPALFLSEVSIIDGVNFSFTFQMGVQSESEQEQQDTENLLTFVFDLFSNLKKMYDNYQTIKHLERAKRDFYEKKINKQDYVALASTLVSEKGGKSLELATKVKNNIDHTYANAQKCALTLKQVLGYLIQRRDKLIDQYIEEKIQREKDAFDEEYYYPYLKGPDLAFAREQQKLQRRLSSLRATPEDPEYIEKAEKILTRGIALDRLRQKWIHFKTNGEGL